MLDLRHLSLVLTLVLFTLQASNQDTLYLALDDRVFDDEGSYFGNRPKGCASDDVRHVGGINHLNDQGESLLQKVKVVDNFVEDDADQQDGGLLIHQHSWV